MINLALLWFQPQAHSKANPKSAYSFFWSQSKASGSAPWKPFVRFALSVSKIERNPTLKKSLHRHWIHVFEASKQRFFATFSFTPWTFYARRVQHRIKEDSSWKQFFLCSRSISEVSSAKHVMHLWFRSEFSGFTTLSALMAVWKENLGILQRLENATRQIEQTKLSHWDTAETLQTSKQTSDPGPWCRFQVFVRVLPIYPPQ